MQYVAPPEVLPANVQFHPTDDHSETAQGWDVIPPGGVIQTNSRSFMTSGCFFFLIYYLAQVRTKNIWHFYHVLTYNFYSSALRRKRQRQRDIHKERFTLKNNVTPFTRHLTPDTDIWHLNCVTWHLIPNKCYMHIFSSPLLVLVLVLLSAHIKRFSFSFMLKFS